MDEEKKLPYWGMGAIEKLRSLSLLEDGFCGDGIKPSKNAVSRAAKILKELINRDLKPDKIAPLAEGGVTFYFKAAHYLSEIIIYNDEDCYIYVSNTRTKPLNKVEEIVDNVEESLL